MKKALLVFGILTLGLIASAIAVPAYLTYQGVLRNASGDLVNGTRSMTFTIYDQATGGTIKYGPQAESSVSVSNGSYTVQLGPISNPTAVFDGGDRYLEVAVEGTTLTPRLKINSIAYAIRAASADAVADDSISTAKIQDLAVTGGKLASNVSGSYNINTSGTITSTNTSGITANKITITSIATTGAGCVGSGTIPGGNNVKVFNNNITADSKIFVTPITRLITTYEALVAFSINPTDVPGPSFLVGLSKSNAVVPAPIDFNYLIIN